MSVELFGVLHPDEGSEQDDGRIFCNDGWGHLMIVVEGDAAGTKPKQIWSLLPYGESEHRSLLITTTWQNCTASTE